MLSRSELGRQLQALRRILGSSSRCITSVRRLEDIAMSLVMKELEASTPEFGGPVYKRNCPRSEGHLGTFWGYMISYTVRIFDRIARPSCNLIELSQTEVYWIIQSPSEEHTILSAALCYSY